MKVLIPILIGLLVVGCGKKTSKPEAKANPPSTSPAQEANNNQPKTDPTPKLEKEHAKPPKAEPKVEVKKPEPPKVAATKLIVDPIVEKAIRKQLKKPSGELTKADLKKLTYLSLYKNQLTELPKGLENLMQLEDLNLPVNKLTNVKGLEKLTQLNFLTLSDNQMTDVKGLDKLPKLQSLKLDGNKLTELPKGLEKLTQLEHLNLKRNPDLTKAQIDELQKALPKCNIYSDPTK